MVDEADESAGRAPGPRRDTSGLEELVGPANYPAALARGGAALTAISGTGVLVAVLLPHPEDSGLRMVPLVALILVSLSLSALLAWRGGSWDRRMITAAAILYGFAAPTGVALLGPGQQQSAAALASMAGPIFFFLPRRSAGLVVGTALAGYAVVLGTRAGYPGPATRWVIVASLCCSSAAVMAWIADRLRTLSAAERAAAAEVSRLNAVLEERVDDLGRFLSPQVAAAVRDTGDRSVLQPHRRRIAVLFVDLRGFTGFTSGAEPEEVVDVLTSYYTVVGRVAHRLGATIGSFIGDGVMAYFGDPVPIDDPAGSAVEMAVELRPPLDELVRGWATAGFDLGYGIGVAFGYATLGAVGFEGRSDYTALGSVVNLASRLCAEAGDGEVLVDPRAHGAVCDRFGGTEREVRLKGYPGTTRAYCL